MIVLPLSPFPNGYWFSHYLSTGTGQVVLDPYENYIKQSWRNRYDILSANGPMALTIPVVGQKGQKIPLKDIEIAPGTWRRQHCQSIQSAYGSSPYFIHYFDELENCFRTEYKWLLDFNLSSLRLIHTWLELDREPSLSENYVNSDISLDLRKAFKPAQVTYTTPTYPQVFEGKMDFVPNLSVIDIIMNEGPMALTFLKSLVMP